VEKKVSKPVLFLFFLAITISMVLWYLPLICFLLFAVLFHKPLAIALSDFFGDNYGSISSEFRVNKFYYLSLMVTVPIVISLVVLTEYVKVHILHVKAWSGEAIFLPSYLVLGVFLYALFNPILSGHYLLNFIRRRRRPGYAVFFLVLILGALETYDGNNPVVEVVIFAILCSYAFRTGKLWLPSIFSSMVGSFYMYGEWRSYSNWEINPNFFHTGGVAFGLLLFAATAYGVTKYKVDYKRIFNFKIPPMEPRESDRDDCIFIIKWIIFSIIVANVYTLDRGAHFSEHLRGKPVSSKGDLKEVVVNNWIDFVAVSQPISAPLPAGTFPSNEPLPTTREVHSYHCVVDDPYKMTCSIGRFVLETGLKNMPKGYCRTKVISDPVTSFRKTGEQKWTEYFENDVGNESKTIDLAHHELEIDLKSPDKRDLVDIPKPHEGALKYKMTYYESFQSRKYSANEYKKISKSQASASIHFDDEARTRTESLDIFKNLDEGDFSKDVITKEFFKECKSFDWPAK
jgi:hypothetical protein